MGGLRDLRVDVAALLEPVLPGRVYPTSPDTLVAPAIWVRRAAIVADGKGLRWLRVDIEVVVVVDTATHGAYDQLDDMVEQCWVLLAKNGHSPTRSAEATLDTGTGQPFHADVISVTSSTDCT